ncbi:YqcC family protein [Alteromonas sp. AMM-1]|uniref:YqcC family protein n=1 Tax=Alteromonas sp. AMM-1 TaxID=3394233 RepID=UPI0039A7585D
MTDAVKRGNLLLEALENALQDSGLWGSETPSASALASQQPFACDTLALEQWLQFIFLPRMQSLLAKSEISVPVMAIKPVAEIVWGSRHAEVQRILGELDSWSEQA